MPIRSRNMDLELKQNRSIAQASFGDITATLKKVLFSAPYSCKVDRILIASTGSYSASTSDTLNLVAFNGTTAGAQMISRTFNTSAATSAAIIGAMSAIELVPTVNNSMSRGQLLTLQVSAVCNVTLSQVFVQVEYTKMLHRDNR